MRNKIILILLLLGIMVRLAYWSATPPYTRAHDIPGHISYIQYIAKHRSLPKASDCWECYLPPVYYAAVSPVCFLFPCEDKTDQGLYILQAISLLFSVAFLIFGVATLRLLLPEHLGNRYFYLASALLIFWPAGIIGSVPINNDGLSSLFSAACIYFAVRWFVRDSRADLYGALGLAILSALTKSNGVILFALLMALAVFRVLQRRSRMSLIRDGAAIALGLALLGSISVGSLYVRHEDPVFGGLKVASRYMDAKIVVRNDVNSLLYFDVKDFLSTPYADPRRDPGGRQYLLNFMMKTSLFGEYRFEKQPLRVMAMSMSLLSVFLAASVLSGIYLAIRDRQRCLLASVAAVPVFLVSLAAFRYFSASAPSGDFRYILPVVIPAAALIAYAVRGFDAAVSSEKADVTAHTAGAHLLSWLFKRPAEIAAAAFVTLSAAFYLILAFIK